MEVTQFIVPGVGLVLAVFLLLFVRTILNLRRVVSTNEVHIVQTAKRRVSYGAASEAGNTYYEWPDWVPVIGVTKSVLPLSVFSLDLNNYQAYDRDRLPFLVHLLAFFRIADSNAAAERLGNVAELKAQLTGVVQGAVRAILATHTIHEIMQDREVFANRFTESVRANAQNWGVETVKALELMDIKDTDGSKVIHNIMEKKKSHIEMESRIEVAKNNQAAEIAEINAKQAVDLQDQQAKQAVGLRTIEAERQVELQSQEKTQAIQEQAKVTREKEMAVKQVEALRAAEIEKGVQVVRAQQSRETQVTVAEGQKQVATLAAEGQLEAKRREAEGIQLEGTARAAAEKALQLAPVEAQIVLAKEIGGNASYQQYLVTIRRVEAEQAVGTAQAAALAKAEVKVIANTGSGPAAGLASVSELFSAKGGTQLGAMLEGLAQTDVGSAALKAAGLTPPAKTNGTTKA